MHLTHTQIVTQMVKPDLEPKFLPQFSKDYQGKDLVHLLATEDWMEAMRVKPGDNTDKFKHTLQHLARKWYQSLDTDQFQGQWCKFTKHFSRYFSTQGRNIKHLHERWQTFSFDPTTDDIEEYI